MEMGKLCVMKPTVPDEFSWNLGKEDISVVRC